MESPIKTTSHGPGLSFARCNTRFWRGSERASRETGMMAVFGCSAGAAGALVCARSCPARIEAIARTGINRRMVFICRRETGKMLGVVLIHEKPGGRRQKAEGRRQRSEGG